MEINETPVCWDRALKASKEIFEAGFAIQTYNIMSDVQNWRYFDEHFKTFNVPREKKLFISVEVYVAPIEEVRKAAIKRG